MPTGWRVWGVDRAGRLGPAFFHTGPQKWGTGWLEGECRRGHRAPAPECFCVLHLMADEDDVWAFVRARYRPGVSGAVAVGRVEYGGTAMESLIPGDPASTLRRGRDTYEDDSCRSGDDRGSGESAARVELHVSSLSNGPLPRTRRQAVASTTVTRT